MTEVLIAVLLAAVLVPVVVALLWLAWRTRPGGPLEPPPRNGRQSESGEDAERGGRP